MSDATWNDEDAELVEVTPRLLVERYQVGEPLGEGGFAEVFRGLDVRTGRQVALKRLRPRADDRLLRRELVALRYARVPGVVRLLDDLRVDGVTWLVLELAEGGPFPGPDQPTRADPEEVRARTIALLRILARLHRLGLAHQDLKPNNVLVDDAGVVRVLDLGIASAVWLGAAHADGFEGTLRFAAPEQRRSALLDRTSHDRVRADLYAVGAMVWEALAGCARFGEMSRRDAWRALVVADEDPPFPAVRDVRDGVSADFADLVDALLAFDPAARPADADEALARLGVCPPALPPHLLDGVPDDADAGLLAGLFHGPEALLHLPSRAATALRRLAGGRRGGLAEVLEAWLAHEIVVVDGDKLRVDREALARLERDVSGAAPAGSTSPDLRARWPALQVALLDARSAGDVDAECGLLIDVTATAIQIEDNDALDHALRLLDDESGAPDLARAAAGLVRYWYAAAVRRDLGLADATGALAPSSFLDERLAANLQGARFMHALLRGPAEADMLLDTLRTWAAGVPYREARRQGWLGLLRYQQARYPEAAAAHARSAALREHAAERLSSRVNELLAHLEAGAHARVRAEVPAVLREASAARMSRLELLACVADAVAAYRMGAPAAVDPDVLACGPEVSVPNTAVLQLVGAADAWRRGAAAELSRAAARVADSGAPRAVRLLVDAMCWDAGVGRRVTTPEQLATEAWATPPAVAAQVIALLPEAIRRSHRERALAAIRQVPGDRAARREVLSIEEVEARLGAADQVAVKV